MVFLMTTKIGNTIPSDRRTSLVIKICSADISAEQDAFLNESVATIKIMPEDSNYVRSPQVLKILRQRSRSGITGDLNSPRQVDQRDDETTQTKSPNQAHDVPCLNAVCLEAKDIHP